MSNNDSSQDCTSFEVETNVLPLAAIQQAAHEFCHLATIDIEVLSGQRLRLTLAPVDLQAPRLADNFRARVIDIALQHRINEQTRTIREALVKAALWESLP